MKEQTEKLTDAQLSQRLGSYQKTESIGILLGVILVIAACVSMFIQRDPLLVCALAFPGVALFLLVAKPAQTKKKALLQQQLGGYFRAELTRMFGVEPATPSLPIDWAYLEAAKLTAVPWTECSINAFHEEDFNKRFNLSCDDEQWALRFLNQSRMERILRLADSAFSEFAVTLCGDGRLYIAAHSGHSFFDAGKGRETPDALRQRFTRELTWFTDVIDTFRPV